MRILKSLQNRIYEIRNQHVMLAFDLASLYEVDQLELDQAVSENTARLPENFMFRLTPAEWSSIRLRAVAATEGNSVQPQNSLIHKYQQGFDQTPLAFTAQGIAMLSSILHSEKAIKMNITLMDVIAGTKNLDLKNSSQNDSRLSAIFEAFENLASVAAPAPIWEEREPIGFRK